MFSTVEELEAFSDGKGNLPSGFDWDAFQEILGTVKGLPNILNEDEVKQGWLTSTQYQDEYGPPTSNSNTSNPDVTAIMLVATGDDDNLKYHLDIILKNNEGKRFFYTLTLHMENLRDFILKPQTTAGRGHWVAWKKPIYDDLPFEMSPQDAIVYFEDITYALDITHLFPGFRTSLKTHFLNWYNDNPLEGKR